MGKLNRIASRIICVGLALFLAGWFLSGLWQEWLWRKEGAPSVFSPWFAVPFAIVIGLVILGVRHVTAAGRQQEPSLGPENQRTDDEAIEAYSRLLEGRKELFGKESDLPFPKDRIHAALIRAKHDPIYWVGGPAVDVALSALDTFVPDADLMSTIEFYQVVAKVGRSSDDATFAAVLEAAPELQRRAVLAVFATLKAAGVRPPGEEVVTKSNKSADSADVKTRN